MRLEARTVRAPAAVAGRGGPLERLDPRWLIVGAGLFVVAVVATPPVAWRALAVEGLVVAFLLGLSGLDPWRLARRWAGLLLAVGFLAVMVARGHPLRAQIGLVPLVLGILAKNALALATILIATGTMPFPRLLAALRGLGVPAVLVATLLFMERYGHVLGDELDRMSKARRSRSFGRRRMGWGLLSGLIGHLFIRAMERGERVHAAMCARGWDGTVRSLEEDAG